VALTKITGDGYGAGTITTADNNPQLTLTTTDADAGTGPTLDLFRNSASPADADVGGKISFSGKNDAGETLGMAIFQASHVDVTDGTEDAKLAISSRSAGSMVSRLNLDATETVFNEDSVDVDFRVESDGNANMLFVNAGDDKVGIGTSSPSQSLDVSGSGNQAIAITSTNSGDTSINFADDDNNIGKLTYHHSNNNMSFRVNDAERMRIGNTGQASFSADVNDYALVIHNDGNNTNRFGVRIRAGADGGSGTTDLIAFGDGDGDSVGSISFTGSTTSYNTSSDYRLKESINYTWDATTRLKQLKPARFNFIRHPNITVDGFLAHEVSSIVPEAITGTKDETRSVSNAVLSSAGKLLAEDTTQDEWAAGKLATTDAEGNSVDAIYPSDSTWTASHTEPVMQGIDQSKLVPLLVKTIQELEARITALESA
jgi:hypothetical protein